MVRYHGYDDGGPDGHDYAGRWIRGILWFAAVVFVGHLMLSRVGFIARWVDALPATVNLPRFGGTLPAGWPLWLWQHPVHMYGVWYRDWIRNILGRFP